MLVRLTFRQKTRLKNIVFLLIGGYLFITWSRQGSQTYSGLKGDSVLQQESFNNEPGFHEIPDYKIARQGPGENGQGVVLQGEEHARGQKQIKELFMNVIASCDANCSFHREQNAKKVAKGEELTHVKEHIKRFGSLVRLYRSTERLGLIRAKVYGARKATGDVIVFLDAHCEANEGWIEPLLARIQEERTAVVCPTIDSISAHSMAYLGGAAGGIGSFWWSLHYSMEGMPKSEIKRRKNPATDYIRTPTMAGGLFAVGREYFFEIGAYDEEMDIWGGENLEISFRVWMCGGSVEIIPCSHVGHIYRDGHPYNMTGRGGNLDVHGTNSKRLAEVWMDDYKRLYYMYRMGLKDQPVGDISSRLELRRRLKCQSFKWFLDNVIPQKFIMDEDVHAFGQVTGERGLCLDTLQRLENKGTVDLGVYNCQGGGSSSEMFSISKPLELRREATCVDIGSQVGQGAYKVVLRFCNSDAPIAFDHPKGGGHLKHHDRQLCIDAEGVESGGDLVFRKCEEGKKSQQWKFTNYYNL